MFLFLTFVEVLAPKCSSKKLSVLGGDFPLCFCGREYLIVKTKLSFYHHGFEENINI